MDCLYRPAVGLLSCCFIASVVGCGGGKGAATPEECWAKIQEAAKAKDVGAIFDNITDESQDALAGALAMVGKMMPAMSQMTTAFGGEEAASEVNEKMDGLANVLKKHGVSAKFDLAAMMQSGEPDPKALDKLAADIADKRAFVLDMMVAMQELGDDSGAPSFDEMEKDLLMEIGKITIDGDRATAKYVRDDEEHELTFAKTSSGWKVDLLPIMQQGMPQGPPQPGAGAMPGGASDESTE